jgi:hypothetical protein
MTSQLTISHSSYQGWLNLVLEPNIIISGSVDVRGVQVHVSHAANFSTNSFVKKAFPWTALTTQKSHIQLMSHSLTSYDLYCLIKS